MTSKLQSKLIIFFENCDFFFGQNIEIHSAISSNQLNFDRHFTSFAYTKFKLLAVQIRISGGRARFEGDKLYYELGVDHLISFEEMKENEFEFIEKYSEMVYRRTRLKISEK